MKVCAAYSPEDTAAHIRDFFAQRKEALLDLGRSMPLLFSNAQWLGFKHASPELLDQIEQLANPDERMAPYVMIRQLQAIYGVLGNGQLMRLVWQTFMFSMAPFLSVPGNLNRMKQNHNPLRPMIELCREGNGPALRTAVEAFQRQKSVAFDQFCAQENIPSLPENQTVFMECIKGFPALLFAGYGVLIAISLENIPSDRCCLR